ncbi:MAG: nucleotide-binding protein [Desulfomonile tiedjei]|nr:nucleotide-binding protein [Desulfomonile tiedjei]
MSELIDELLHIDSELRDFVKKYKRPEIDEPLKRLTKACEEVGKAWSRSWIGYQANVYYADLEPPPPGDHFSAEWGFESSSGDWHEYDHDGVRNFIHEKAGNPDLKAAHDLEKEGGSLIDNKRSEIISILETVLSLRQDPFLNSLKDEAEEKRVFTASDFVKQRSPKQYMSRDTLAMGQGTWVPPHIDVFAEVFSIQNRAIVCQHLADIAKRAASHLKRVEKSTRRSEMIGTNVFLGHGGALIWRELKDFIEDRLNLPCDEFNRVPIAGITNIDRLAEMLDAAAFAFLVLTGEDEQADGRLHARMNVVHEAGLFQGRLGFRRAIVVFEEGCEEFSNIEGLGQIRFPKGKIKSAFEEVRQVLEREGLIAS